MTDSPASPTDATDPEPRGASRRPRRRRRRAWGCLFRAPVYLTLLLLTGFIALVGWLGSERGGEVLARFVATRVADALGGTPVSVGRVRWDLWPLALEAEDVRVASRDADQPPLAEVPFVRVDLSLAEGTGWGRPTIRLDQVYLREPRIYLQLDEGGRTNLPKFPRGAAGGERRVRLAALVVERGQVRFNATEYPLDFAAKEVLGRLSETGDGIDPHLEGAVTVGEVMVGLPKARPYPVALTAKLWVDRRRLEVVHAQVSSPELRATGRGSVEFAPDRRRSSFTFTASGDAVALRRLGYVPEPEVGEVPLVEGRFRFDGRADWRPGQGSVTGTLDADRLVLAGRVFEGFTGPLAIDPERVTYQFGGAGYAGGSVSGTVEVLVRPPDHPVTVGVELAEVDLRTLAADQGLELPAPVTGRVSGTAQYHFQPAEPFRGQGGAELRLSAVPGSTVPLAGPARLVLADGVLAVAEARFTTPGEDHVVTTREGRFDLLARTGRFTWQVATGNVGDLARWVLPPSTGPDAAWLPTAGVGTVRGELTVAPERVATSVDFDLVEVAAAGGLADRLTGGFVVSAAGVEALNLALERGAGRLGVTGTLPFGQAPLGLKLEPVLWPLDSRLAAWLPAEVALEGAASGRLELEGTASSLAGSGRLLISPARLQGLDVGALTCDFGFGSDLIDLRECAADTPAGRVTVLGSSREGTIDLRVEAPRLDLTREPLASLVDGSVAGVAAVSAQVGGTLERPRLLARATVTDLVVGGRRLATEDGAVSRLEIDWDGAKLESELHLGEVATLRGGGPLTLESADLRYFLTVPEQTLALTADLAPLTVALTGELAVTGPPRRPGELVFTLEADQLTLRQAERRLVNREPVRARLAGTGLRIESLFLGTPESDDFVFLTGGVELAGTRALDLKLQATAAASWLQPWLGTTQLTGSIDALAALRGTLDRPEFSGQGELLSGAVRFPDPEFPPRLDELGAVVYFDPRQIKLDSLQARLGNGRLTASGGVDLAAWPQVEYLFEGTLEDVDLRYPEGFVFRGDADLLLESTPEGRRLRGLARLERAFYLDDVKLGLVDLVRTALAGSRQLEATTDPWLGSTALSLSVRAPGAVRVSNNLADLRGSAELQVRGSLARPLVLGTVDLEPGGTLVQDENRFELEQGRLTWNGPVLDPVVELTATARIKSYEVTLALSGPASRLRLDLTSDPPLPDVEVFSLLAGGVPAETQNLATTTESGTDAARRILVGQLGSALGQRVGTLFGLDRVAISPEEGEGAGSLGAVGVTLGKRLSKDVFVTFTQRPGSSREREMKVEWQVTDNLTVVLVGLQDEAQDLTYSIDALWTTRF
ncbi:MAG: translocation/assembly module TamB domain-containing protein [Thermoanaerobaculia bacterium]|nr:translocation/assembly module TamB domain-containing protein [Thermoanaerobaculia bacterium]